MVNVKNIKEELKKGDYYYCDWSSPGITDCSSIAFISFNYKNNNLNVKQILIHDKTINITNWLETTNNIQRKATSEEIDWFKYCIDNSKYITKEEFLELNIKKQLIIW
jgi:hypothetical protein